MTATRLLHELPEDALHAIYEHVEVPYVLKLACRALRAAGPKRTRTTMARVAKSWQSLRLAREMRFPFTWDAAFASVIAENGNLHVLMWAWAELNLPVDNRVVVAAAFKGHLDVVKFLLNAHPEECKPYQKIAKYAASHGQFHIVRWLGSMNLPIDRDTLHETVEWGDFDTFLWLVNGVRILPSNRCLFHAALGSGLRKRKIGEHLKIVKALRRPRELGLRLDFNGAQWPQDAFCTASVMAPIEMLKYMRSDGCDDPNPQLSLMHAATNNRRDVLEWLLAEFGSMYELNPRVAWAAARNGHIELLKWLRERGCPWDKSAVEGAVQHAISDGSMRALRWIAANGGHIFHRTVRLDFLRMHLKHTPTGPLPDQLVPDAMWVHTLMRWRKVKLLVRKWDIALFWQRKARERKTHPPLPGVRAQKPCA
tara:strand:- start:1201 stop:2472 length:1272 start_codon:yes stop_codon:yes gene_type:complete